MTSARSIGRSSSESNRGCDAASKYGPFSSAATWKRPALSVRYVATRSGCLALTSWTIAPRRGLAAMLSYTTPLNANRAGDATSSDTRTCADCSPRASIAHSSEKSAVHFSTQCDDPLLLIRRCSHLLIRPSCSQADPTREHGFATFNDGSSILHRCVFGGPTPSPRGRSHPRGDGEAARKARWYTPARSGHQHGRGPSASPPMPPARSSDTCCAHRPGWPALH